MTQERDIEEKLGKEVTVTSAADQPAVEEPRKFRGKRETGSKNA